MRIAIVEDDGATQQMLADYIDRYFEHDSKRYSIAVFSDGDEIVERFHADYDLILLDIQMQRMDGLKTAEYIRKLDENVYLIFVTNLAHYAIQGYAVNALDFVLKPVNYYMLEQLLLKVERLLSKKGKCYVTLPTDQGLMRIDAAQIYFIEYVNRQLIIHSEKGKYHMRDTLRNLEEMLEKYGFFRCNSCYLVNLAYVEQVDREGLMLMGEKLTISRPRYKPFMEALTKYIGGVKQ